uniref:Uncharacterized protein n=1 Tax=Romanomermis culicivorax TaxID=13658 RepID=A0A915IAM7_ROMCU
MIETRTYFDSYVFAERRNEQWCDAFFDDLSLRAHRNFNKSPILNEQLIKQKSACAGKMRKNRNCIRPYCIFLCYV